MVFAVGTGHSWAPIHMLLSTKRDAVPIIRDFIADAERSEWTKTKANTTSSI